MGYAEVSQNTTLAADLIRIPQSTALFRQALPLLAVVSRSNRHNYELSAARWTPIIEFSFAFFDQTPARFQGIIVERCVDML